MSYLVLRNQSLKEKKKSSDDDEEDTPVPMPNTEVKLFGAECSWVRPARIGSR